MTKRRRGGGFKVLAFGAAAALAVGGGLYLKGEGEKTDAAQVELASWLQTKGASAAVGKLAIGSCQNVQLPVFGLGEYHRNALDGNNSTHEPDDVDIYVASGDKHNAAVYDHRFGDGEQGAVRLGLGVPEAAAGTAAVNAQVCRTGGDDERVASFEVRMSKDVPTDWVVLNMAQLPPPPSLSPSAPHS